MTGRIDMALDGEGVAVVTLDNCGKRNALSAEMWSVLRECFEQLNRNDQLRCVQIRGAGELAFAAGADIAEFDTVRKTREQVEFYHEVLVSGALCAIRDCPVPVVAGIRGACAGGGLEIAALSDLRIASESARFGIPVSRLGFSLAYAEMELIWSAVPPAVLAELLFEARMLDAREALDKGLVHRVVTEAEFDAAVAATMARVVAGAPLVNRAHKRQWRRLIEHRTPLSRDERLASYGFADTEDYAIGRQAFLDKTAPHFKGR